MMEKRNVATSARVKSDDDDIVASAVGLINSVSEKAIRKIGEASSRALPESVRKAMEADEAAEAMA